MKLPPELKLSPLGRGPTRWYVRTIWEEYTGWFRQDLTSELYATPASAVGPPWRRWLAARRPWLTRPRPSSQAGEPEKALHMIEIAVAAAPDDKVVRTTEARILVQLINNTHGEGFDEIGWLETKLAEARGIVESEIDESG